MSTVLLRVPIIADGSRPIREFREDVSKDPLDTIRSYFDGTPLTVVLDVTTLVPLPPIGAIVVHSIPSTSKSVAIAVEYRVVAGAPIASYVPFLLGPTPGPPVLQQQATWWRHSSHHYVADVRHLLDLGIPAEFVVDHLLEGFCQSLGNLGQAGAAFLLPLLRNMPRLAETAKVVVPVMSKTDFHSYISSLANSGPSTAGSADIKDSGAPESAFAQTTGVLVETDTKLEKGTHPDSIVLGNTDARGQRIHVQSYLFVDLFTFIC